MAATWTVSTMERTLTDGDLSDVVTTLHWQLIDSETVDEIVHSGRCYGTVGLSEPDADSFTDYDSITHEQAVEWVKSALGEDAVAQYETSVESQIALSKEPVSASGVPESWA